MFERARHRRRGWLAVLAALVAVLLATPVGAVPGTDDTPQPVESVPELVLADDGETIIVDGHILVPAEAALTAGEHGYHAVTGAGFTLSGNWAANRGAYRFVLRASPGVEALRSPLEDTARRLNNITGGRYSVAPGQVTHDTPREGEILVRASATSPCSGFAPNWVGCAGVSQVMPHGQGLYAMSGVVWIHSNVLSSPFLQTIIDHEVGHALGLGHYDQPFESRWQVMRSVLAQIQGFEAGDINGLRYLHPTAPLNNSFASPTQLAAAGGTVSQLTLGATRHSGEPNHAGVTDGGSVWFTWTAPSTGMAEFNTAGSTHDTALAVYTGDSLGALQLLGDNHDAEPGHTFSRVTVPVSAGQTYRIAADGPNGGAGRLTLNTVPPQSMSFTSMSPRRLLDTRTGIGWTGGAFQGGREYVLQIGGNVGIPNTARAAMLNVTVVNPTDRGFLTIYPCDSRVRGAASLNYAAGETVNNSVVSRASVNNGGRVCIWSRAATDLVIDVVGYAGPSGSSRYVAVQPERVTDTRNGLARTGAIEAGETWQLEIVGTAGVPADATAVALNVAATQAEGRGFVTVFPCGQPRPTASSLNFVQDRTVPNLVVSGVGSGGRICVYSNVRTHLVLDLNGWFAPAGSQLAPLTPTRLLDTRAALGTSSTTRLEADQTLELQVAGRGGVPAGARAAVLNLVVTEPAGSGFVTLWPCDQPRPVAANLNYVAGQTTSNLAMSDLDPAGRVCVYSLTTTHVVIDTSGFTSPPG